MRHDPNSAAAAELNPRRPTPGRPADTRRPAGNVPLDELEMLDSVLGDRLVLTEHGPDEPLELHRIDAGQASLLGVFVDAAAAWRALDDLDAPPRSA